MGGLIIQKILSIPNCIGPISFFVALFFIFSFLSCLSSIFDCYRPPWLLGLLPQFLFFSFFFRSKRWVSPSPVSCQSSLGLSSSAASCINLSLLYRNPTCWSLCGCLVVRLVMDFLPSSKWNRWDCSWHLLQTLLLIALK